jgi:hypothetical protein
MILGAFTFFPDLLSLIGLAAGFVAISSLIKAKPGRPLDRSIPLDDTRHWTAHHHCEPSSRTLSGSTKVCGHQGGPRRIVLGTLPRDGINRPAVSALKGPSTHRHISSRERHRPVPEVTKFRSSRPEFCDRLGLWWGRAKSEEWV